MKPGQGGSCVCATSGPSRSGRSSTGVLPESRRRCPAGGDKPRDESVLIEVNDVGDGCHLAISRGRIGPFRESLRGRDLPFVAGVQGEAQINRRHSRSGARRSRAKRGGGATTFSTFTSRAERNTTNSIRIGSSGWLPPAGTTDGASASRTPFSQA